MPEEIKKPAVLMILDGFGIAPDSDGNAITRANTPVFDRLIRTYPTMTLRASGEEVGLSWGEMGNSEVGHLALGAGRVYYQTLPRINKAVEAGEFATNKAFVAAAEHVKKNNSRLHIIGLASAGRVHAMDSHCHALLAFAKDAGIKEVYVHAVLDGRDTIYNAGIDFITTLQAKMSELKIGEIVTVSGRYYAMDRDNRWDRVEKAYKAMAHGIGEQAEDPIAAIKTSYQKEIYDEEFVPTVITKNGLPIGNVRDNDAVIFFNYRADRMRELVRAFVMPEFGGFERERIGNLFVVTMTEYETGLPVEVAFPPEKIEKSLAQVLSEAGKTQLHIAETEKYAHVTFFLNGTVEDPFVGEERIIIPSPKVSSYDSEPEMSARKITERVIKEMRGNKYDFIVLNFANPDMVAHTGNIVATTKGVEVTDECVGKIIEETLSRDGVAFITADHGNAEEMKNLRTGEMDKEHATNPVPFVIIGKKFEGLPSVAGEVPEGDLSLLTPVGVLADVAPTILAIIGVQQPPEMTGQALI
jgi:2,3-bisphosphoglycerate-independent phosphoglycerate mutase